MCKKLEFFKFTDKHRYAKFKDTEKCSGKNEEPEQFCCKPFIF